MPVSPDCASPLRQGGALPPATPRTSPRSVRELITKTNSENLAWEGMELLVLEMAHVNMGVRCCVAGRSMGKLKQNYGVVNE